MKIGAFRAFCEATTAIESSGENRADFQKKEKVKMSSLGPILIIVAVAIVVIAMDLTSNLRRDKWKRDWQRRNFSRHDERYTPEREDSAE